MYIYVYNFFIFIYNIIQLSWFDFEPLEEKTAADVSLEKLNPQVRIHFFLHQNWRFALAKPWICANYADGKNSAGMFMSICAYVYVDAYVYAYVLAYVRLRIRLRLRSA